MGGRSVGVVLSFLRLFQERHMGVSCCPRRVPPLASGLGWSMVNPLGALGFV